MARIVLGPGAHGGLVAEVQRALLAAGCDPHGIDGGYGGHTSAAVGAFLQSRGLPASGVVDEQTWTLLLQKPAPGTDLRSLELTAAFEGHNYTLAVGNFDGAWLTWGIIGFTLRYGKVSKILLEIEAQHPQLLEEAFGPNAARLMSVMHGPAADQESWADSVTVRGLLAEPWRTGFATLGGFPEVVAIQRRLAHDDYFLPALATARKYGLRSELGLALCFDIHVQNGGIGRKARAEIRQAVADHPDPDETFLRQTIAEAVANGARTKWREDVRRRKLAIANGRGTVHGHEYVLENWGLAEDAAPELEPAATQA